jgi:DNA-binding transcriptional LysR family regulator
MVASHDRVLDTRMLYLLHVLLTERSVSRTAAILGQSPPAVSTALKRLRRVLDDPILVRSGSRLVPTERAQALVEPVRRALENIDRIIDPEERFDPALCVREIRVAIADCMGPLLLPRLLRLVREQAPRARLTLRSVEPEFDYALALEEGELDVAIGCWPQPPLNTRSVLLVEDDLVCLVDERHELAHRHFPSGRLTLRDYLELDHLVRTLNQVTCPGLIHDCLTELGVSRRIAATVPEFSLAPSFLLDSDLVFTTGRLFAEHWTRLLPLRIVEAPVELRAMRTRLLWHDRAQRSVSASWLRELVRQAAREVTEGRDRDARTSARPAAEAGPRPHAAAVLSMG